MKNLQKQRKKQRFNIDSHRKEGFRHVRQKNIFKPKLIDGRLSLPKNRNSRK